MMVGFTAATIETAVRDRPLMHEGNVKKDIGERIFHDRKMMDEDVT